jgi:16S rRNA (guanine527-N7)-methyltransferase
MDDSPRARLERGAAQLGLALDAGQLERLLRLVELVLEWNRKFNLTAIREPLAMVDKHLLDSLTVQPHLRGPFVTDVGTGAGFPGLPLAIANPTFRFTLIDSIAKKARFVTHAAKELGLAEVKVECVRAEHYRPAQRASTVVARALAPLPVFIAEAGHLCAKGGRLLAMKGKDPATELAGLPAGWKPPVVERLHVPGLADERHLVILERES